MISFIMPAKNTSLYIGQAVNSLRKANYENWELIVIDDHSTDDTYRILKQAEETDSRIKVFKNKGAGKVVGLNYGYTFTSGEIIKCIDADDVLAETFFDYLEDITDCEASCHDCYITNSDLKVVGEYTMNKALFGRSFEHCMKNLISLPRWTWSFKRSIGNVIFPMPEDLPFEDVWFSLIIKKHAGANIRHIVRPLYYYRQHGNQAFGGILNFNREIISFRAKRMLRLMDVIEHEQTRRLISGMNDEDFFDEVRHFYELMAKEPLNLGEIALSGIPLDFKIKLLLYKKLRFLAPRIMKLKWLFDRKEKSKT